MSAPDRADYDDYVHLIRQVDELVASFEQHPDEATRERVMTLLTGIDLLHRTALSRLVEGLRDHGAGGALDRVAADRVVETLLAFYDLAELDIPDELSGDPGPDRPPHASRAGAAGAAGAEGADGADGAVAFVPREKLTIRRSGGGR